MLPHIFVENLVKTYTLQERRNGLFGTMKDLFSPTESEYRAVNGISFSVERGEKVAFLGPNGAGKSTTIKILVGILHATSGAVSVAGYDPGKDRENLLPKIGVVFGQVSRLLYHLSPIDTYELFQKLYDIPKNEFKDRLEWLLDIFEAREFAHRPVRKLSLGQRMRSEIVASLVYRPEILFLDEPTIGLDMIAKERFRSCVNEINREWGTTVFLTSHDMGDVDHICDRVMVVNGGEVCFDGGLNALKDQALTHQILKIRSDVDIPETPEMRKIPSEISGEYIFEVQRDPKVLKKVLAHVASFDIVHMTMENPDTESLIRELYLRWKKE